MEHEYIILLPFLLLAALVLILAIIAAVKFRKLYANKDQEDLRVVRDDIPGRYMDIQYSEQPFVEVY